MPQPLVVIFSLITNLLFGHLPLFHTKTQVIRPDPVVEKISKMSLEEKVRQVMICSFNSQTLDPALKVLKNCGNLFYGKNNLSDLSVETISQNNQAIHLKDPSAWIVVDQEGGSVARIKDDSPSPRKMAEDNQVSYWGEKHGHMLKHMNFDVDLAPVVDITGNNPAIKNRSFADDPKVNGTKATEYLVALQKQGVLGVIKHLPGHGRVDSDTHKKSGTLNYSWDEIRNFDLIPFIDTIENGGARLVMVGHIVILELDKKPASISTVVLEKLRSELPHGNELIFLTDSLAMDGVGLPQEEAAVEALKAGEDMILVEGIDSELLFDKIITAYSNGTLDKTKLDQSVTRILKLKSSTTQPLSLL